MTMIGILLMLIYVGYLLVRMVHHEDDIFSKLTFINNMEDGNNEFKISDFPFLPTL